MGVPERPITAPSVAFIGDENARLRSRLLLRKRARMIKRRRFKKVLSLGELLEREAMRLRARAEKLAQGDDRHHRNAQQADTASILTTVPNSPGLQPPE